MMKTKILNTFITILLGFIYFYFLLPPLNVTAIPFWIFIGFMAIIFMILNSTTGAVNIIKKGKMPTKFFREEGIIIGFLIIIFLGISLINFVLSPLFIADAYSKRITVNEDKEFISDVKKADPNTIPVIDKESSRRLGDRVMGRMPDLVSQFSVSNLYTQINYKNEIVRITPLEYSDIFKVFTNGKNGVTGFIKVNSVTGEANLIRLDKGMKYMDSAIFSKDLSRKLRFDYPTKVFGEKTFEVDDSGNPFWIIPTLSYKGINIRTDVEGVIILNPVDGSSEFYEVGKIPTWVDHVYPSDLIIEQVNNWGSYRNGFFNSIFGQKNVVVTTEGYNYTVMNDDVYLYTGITSVVADESNIGFILTNLRTKETKFYSVPGAEEFSAMNSAKGQVQEKNYTATFPLLVNINDKATYFVSLKDKAGLVKMFAFVDVADYQKVVVTDASRGIDEAIKNYIGKDEVINDNLIEKTISVMDVRSSIIDGTTFYYIKDLDGSTYKVSVKVNEALLPFVSVNDVLKVKFIDGTIKNITSITK